MFFHIVQDESNESLVAATVLRVLNNNTDVQIKFAVPNEDGETTDTVNLSNLTLASGLDENKAEKTLLDCALDCVRRGWLVFPC